MIDQTIYLAKATPPNKEAFHLKMRWKASLILLEFDLKRFPYFFYRCIKLATFLWNGLTLQP